jgi:hypothetical protein
LPGYVFPGFFCGYRGGGGRPAAVLFLFLLPRVILFAEL